MTGVNVMGSYRVSWTDKGHILTCGYPRSGKGTNIIVPIFLDEKLQNDDAPSFVCLDPKGENLAICGKHLQECRYKLIVINPFQIDFLSDFERSHYNPFDNFKAGQVDFDSYVNLIVNSIVPPDEKKHANSYFTDAANRILSIYVRHLMTQDEEEKTIRTLTRWLKYSDDERDELWDKMSVNDNYDIDLDIKDLAHKITDGVKSTSEVMENILTAMKCFSNGPIRQCMSKSDFKISDISTEKTALFICINPEDLRDYAPFMRILVASLMRGFTKFYDHRRKVVMIMDEFYQMGYLSEFERGVDYLAQYVTIWPIIQHIGQLKQLYPAMWNGFIGSAAIRHWMVRDVETAEYLEKRMPMVLQQLGKNSDGSPRYKEKRLLTAVEIMHHEGIIVEADGMKKPAEIEKKPYYLHFANFTKNPLYSKA